MVTSCKFKATARLLYFRDPSCREHFFCHDLGSSVSLPLPHLCQLTNVATVMHLIFCYTPRAIQNLNCLPIFTGCSVTLCLVAYGLVVLRRSFWTQKFPTEGNDGDQPWKYPQVKRGIYPFHCQYYLVVFLERLWMRESAQCDLSMSDHSDTPCRCSSSWSCECLPMQRSETPRGADRRMQSSYSGHTGPTTGHQVQNHSPLGGSSLQSRIQRPFLVT